ncbi:hypothetical protein [Breznakiella homolactica]|uniref:Uncharacterized protein n=1 Tax=Breznakiella homolactica TaxID=2798577 RepID=A0A7T8B940_9SPIR|nr:hypothetical protein [Breznakiella homolactica]QQO07550.1 hypothetical protein JFL75_11380 [Breznakiella homolactica]
MTKDMTNLEVLSTRAGFNSAVRHIKKTISIIESVGVNKNLADLLFELGDEEVSGDRIALLLRILLVDKLGYKAFSTNLSSVIEDPTALSQEFVKWKAVDLVVAYQHPDMGLLVANPKMPEELASFGALRKRELLVIYAGKANKPADELCQKAAETAAQLFEGQKPKISPALYKGNFTVKSLKKTPEPKTAAPRVKKAPVRAPKRPVRSGRSAVQAAKIKETVRVAAPAVTSAAPAPVAKGPVRMTPMYSVVVQNELFHNGNVEAWKKIVASYKAKYPQLEVYIYYDGERILDINSLFKWGKVKHGSSIQFAVAGTDIKDVAKLQRYLIQGASHQFEAFLHGPVNNVLKLF